MCSFPFVKMKIVAYNFPVVLSVQTINDIVHMHLRSECVIRYHTQWRIIFSVETTFLLSIFKHCQIGLHKFKTDIKELVILMSFYGFYAYKVHILNYCALCAYMLIFVVIHFMLLRIKMKYKIWCLPPGVITITILFSCWTCLVLCIYCSLTFQIFHLRKLKCCRNVFLICL